MRLDGDNGVVPFGHRKHAVEVVLDDAEPLLVGSAGRVVAAVGGDKQTASDHVAEND